MAGEHHDLNDLHRVLVRIQGRLDEMSSFLIMQGGMQADLLKEIIEKLPGRSLANKVEVEAEPQKGDTP